MLLLIQPASEGNQQQPKGIECQTHQAIVSPRGTPRRTSHIRAQLHLQPILFLKRSNIWTVRDHGIVFNANHLKRLVREYLGYYHEDRIHDSLDIRRAHPKTDRRKNRDKARSRGHASRRRIAPSVYLEHSRLRLLECHPMSDFDRVFPSLCDYCTGPAKLRRHGRVQVWHGNFSPNVAGARFRSTRFWRQTRHDR